MTEHITRRRGVGRIIGVGALAAVGVITVTRMASGSGETPATSRPSDPAHVSVLSSPAGNAPGMLAGHNAVGGPDSIDPSTARLADQLADGSRVFVGRNAAGDMCLRYESTTGMGQGCGRADLARGPEAFSVTGARMGPARLVGLVADGVVAVETSDGRTIPVVNNTFVVETSVGTPDLTLVTEDGDRLPVPSRDTGSRPGG